MFEIRQLKPGDAGLFRDMLDLFGRVFEDRVSYGSAPPGDPYIQDLLAGQGFIALIATEGGTTEGGAVIGALAGYTLRKFEQERSEIYIYDLAVDAAHRRKGVATALIREVQKIAAESGAWAIFVQADYGDDPAIALYSGLGRREDVLHFDILPNGHGLGNLHGRDGDGGPE